MFILSNVGQTLLIGLAVIVIIVVVIVIANIKIVSQTNAYVIERLGRYHRTWDTGVHFLVPFIDKIADDGVSTTSIAARNVTSKKIGIVNLKEQVCDFDPQPVITKDNVTMQIDTVVYYQITDPKAYVYGVSNPIRALDNLTTTTLRNIMGDLDLDGALTSRDVVNSKMRQILDEATDPWGIKVIRVEVKNIMPPKDIRDAMEKQMRAERERREAILLAEGEKRSNILKAEGVKESEILRAEAKKEALIKEAEGQAESILKINQATAEGLRMIKEAGADESVLTLKAYEALGVMADGKATKIIVPSNLQGLAGLATSLKEIITDPVENKK
jgi:regulator of protease activity HflC (stomatin/prohibitin superfamily)